MSTGKTGAHDVYRDSFLRLLGYSMHIGVACRPFISRRIVALSYSVTMAYILADSIDKGMKEHQSSGSIGNVLIQAGDAALWQYLASVFIPGFIMSKVNYYTRSILRRYDVPYDKFIGCGVILSTIPLIITPIDRISDCILDWTYRKCFN